MALPARADLVLQCADGQQNAVSFQRLDEFSRPTLPIEGLFLNMPVHKPLEVVGLLHDCIGEKAGLQIGDIILSAVSSVNSIQSIP